MMLSKRKLTIPSYQSLHYRYRYYTAFTPRVFSVALLRSQPLIWNNAVGNSDFVTKDFRQEYTSCSSFHVVLRSTVYDLKNIISCTVCFNKNIIELLQQIICFCIDAVGLTVSDPTPS